jgi:hypothetical protein
MYSIFELILPIANTRLLILMIGSRKSDWIVVNWGVLFEAVDENFVVVVDVHDYQCYYDVDNMVVQDEDYLCCCYCKNFHYCYYNNVVDIVEPVYHCYNYYYIEVNIVEVLYIEVLIEYRTHQLKL